METTEWDGQDTRRFPKISGILALVETLSEETLSSDERRHIRQEFCYEHGLSERTIRNYVRRYRQAGPMDFLAQTKRAKSPRIHDEGLAAKILALIADRPTRTVPQLRRLLAADAKHGPALERVSDRTVYRFLLEHGLSQKQRSSLLSDDGRLSYQKFQADHSMALIQGDARDGIWLETPSGKRKTYLFLWIDDFSRKIVGGRYYWDEKLPRMEDSFKHMVLRWGIPNKVYLDNGSVYIAGQFAWLLGQLGVKKVHHRPYQAYCKGKVEAANKTILREFQAEAAQAGFATLEELNTAFSAWVELEYNARNHSQTGQPPDTRFIEGLPVGHRRITDVGHFEALFLLRATRTVTKYGIVKLEGNEYRAAQLPHGTVVEVRYDPFDLAVINLYLNNLFVQRATTATLTNQVAIVVPEERAARPATVSADSARYFERLREAHAAAQKKALATIAFAHLAGSAPQAALEAKS
jgi:transposase InsO family protein